MRFGAVTQGGGQVCHQITFMYLTPPLAALSCFEIVLLEAVNKGDKIVCNKAQN